MNREIVNGNWRQLKGLVIEKWGRLTDDDFKILEGRQEYWAGEMLEARGIALDESRRRVQAPDRGGVGPHAGHLRHARRRLRLPTTRAISSSAGAK